MLTSNFIGDCIMENNENSTVETVETETQETKTYTK